MKNLKVVFSSDWHLGLKTEEIDRTDEIIEIGKDIVNHCISLMEEDHRVILVFGGDMFNVNYPSEYHISRFIEVLNLVRKYKIECYIMVGNHDSIPDPDRSSCMSFVNKIRVAYPTIRLIDDIRFLNVGNNDIGPIYFTFLPHITKALVHKKIKDGKYEGDTNPQKYIDSKSMRILKKLGKEEVTHYAFSHLNVIGAHPGSEENLLKKSEVYLPECFVEPPFGYSYVQPTIIQAHIHSHSVEGKLNIVGSPIYCTFGESGPKYFCEISINHCLGHADEIEFIPTKHRPFMQLELDMMGETKDFFEIEEVAKFLASVKEANKPVVKFDLTIDPEHNNYDWKKIREKVMEECDAVVKPILPRVVMKRTIRSVKQKIDLPIKDKLKVYLKKNMNGDLPRAKRIYKRAQKYIGDENGNAKTR